MNCNKTIVLFLIEELKQKIEEDVKLYDELSDLTDAYSVYQIYKDLQALVGKTEELERLIEQVYRCNND
jgi:hypothetical protein